MEQAGLETSIDPVGNLLLLTGGNICQTQAVLGQLGLYC